MKLLCSARAITALSPCLRPNQEEEGAGAVQLVSEHEADEAEIR